MEKEFTIEELRELSNATVDKLKLRRNKRVFTTIAILAGLAGSVGVANMIGVDPSTVENMAQAIMIANGVVGTFGMLDAYKNHRAISTFKKGLDKLENKEIDEESYFKKWLEEAWHFCKTNYEEILQLVNKDKEHSL